MATSTEACVPPSYPVQPSDLHLYTNILPPLESKDNATDGTESESDAESEDPLQSSASEDKSNPGGSNNSLMFSDKSGESDGNGNYDLPEQLASLHSTGTLNKKKKKSRARTINAQWLTSAEGLQECEAQDAAREEKAWKKADAVA
ncbi:hypothetical protein EDD16DRAFT_1516821 [Pisolithus croceorrhizus]|nr:hypothetical protein EDD16DRAFT_1516821 [Pisolithus croceorrhizus]